jgi:hypothetical protein
MMGKLALVMENAALHHAAILVENVPLEPRNAFQVTPDKLQTHATNAALGNKNVMPITNGRMMFA